jgi:Protein of unknown function (DUF2798)
LESRLVSQPDQARDARRQQLSKNLIWGRRADVSGGLALVMKSIRISQRHSHLIFGLIQSAITCAVAAGIASVPFMETGSFAVHWVKAWASSWLSMLPVVILATPFIRAFVNRLVRKPSQRP